MIEEPKAEVIMFPPVKYDLAKSLLAGVSKRDMQYFCIAGMTFVFSSLVLIIAGYLEYHFGPKYLIFERSGSLLILIGIVSVTRITYVANSLESPEKLMQQYEAKLSKGVGGLGPFGSQAKADTVEVQNKIRGWYVYIVELVVLGTGTFIWGFGGWIVSLLRCSKLICESQ